MTFLDWLSGNIENNGLSREEFLYSTRHIVVIILAIVAVVAISIIFRNKTDKTKRILFVVMASIFLFLEITSRVVNLIFTDDYSLQNIAQKILPLYFCSIAVWLLIISIFFKNKMLLNTAAICGALVTTAYLIYPAVGFNNKIITFSAFYSIFSHALGFVCSYTLVFTKYAKFEYKDFWKTIVIFVAIVAYGLLTSLVIFPITDYIFALENPLGFDSLIPYPVIYAVFLLAFINIFYFTSWLIAKLKSKNKIKAE